MYGLGTAQLKAQTASCWFHAVWTYGSAQLSQCYFLYLINCNSTVLSTTETKRLMGEHNCYIYTGKCDLLEFWSHRVL